MSVINLLSPHVADLIAAGEVVERPASAVKELVENAIDAGARNITVEIRAGGREYIRVTDDGCGMSPEDAGLAFLRHATSKLREARDLEAIATLGFRGEALAAISAVSHVELTTRARGAAEGVRVTLTAGDIDEMGPAGCPEGSTLLVRDLFFNTPARQKFLKSDRAEGAACQAAALRSALGHPEISLRFLRDGEEQFFSPGDGQARSAVYSLLGRELAAGLLECGGGEDGLSVSGFVSAPHAGRGSRAQQYFFLNGRPFRSAALQAALEQAYRNTLLTGRFPACVLYLSLSYGKVDVNVHPSKSEVKFSEEKAVYDCVYYAVRSALEREDPRHSAEIRLSPGTQKVTQAPAPAPAMKPAAPAGPGQKPPVQPYTLGRPLDRQPPAPKPPEDLYVLFRNAPRDAAPPEAAREPDAPAPGTLRLQDSGEAVYTQAPPVPVALPELPREPAPEDFRVIGEALDTYILVELSDALLLIDKHAAHERILFDRLLAGLEPPMSQTLLLPLSWSPGAETVERMEQNLPLLEAAGFQLERFGADGLVLRAVPADCEGDALALLEEVAAALENGRIQDKREALCHTIACKAAIKAGSRSQPQELAALAAQVVSGKVRYCPHGRPVSVRLSKQTLDKQFKRIV